MKQATKTEMNKAVLVRMTPEMHRELDALAKRQERSQVAQIRHLIAEAVERSAA